MKLKKENGKTILVFENDEVKQVCPSSVDYYEQSIASALDITDFEVYDDNPKYISIDGIIYTRDGLILVAVPCGKSGCIKIREGVEVVKDSAFDKSAASKVICPQSLRLIDKYAFRSSVYLTEIVLNEGLKKIGTCAFYDCESLTTTTIPASVDDIGPMAFDSSPLTSLTFAPDRKKSLLIEPMAFEDCTAESLYLPGLVKVQDCNFRGVKSISLDGFSNLPDILRTCIIGIVNPPRLIRFREYRRGFQTPHELSFMPATLGRNGFLTTDTAQTQWLCRAASPSAGASDFAFDAQSTA